MRALYVIRDTPYVIRYGVSRRQVTDVERSQHTNTTFTDVATADART